MNSDMFNIYVEKLITAVTELTKSNILLSAQVSYYEKNTATLNSKIEEMQKSLDEALNKVASLPNN
jgi:chaperonin cofactor prefoldin